MSKLYWLHSEPKCFASKFYCLGQVMLSLTFNLKIGGKYIYVNIASLMVITSFFIDHNSSLQSLILKMKRFKLHESFPILQQFVFQFLVWKM